MPELHSRRSFLTKGLAGGAAALAAGAGLPLCLRAALGGEPRGSSDRPAGKSVGDLAFCGFDCEAECEVFKGTRDGNLEIKRQTARRWAEHFGVVVKPEDVACDGCRSKTGRLGYHCQNVCDVRKCALKRGETSCAVCADFPGCDKALWKQWTAMRRRTEESRCRRAREAQARESGASNKDK